MPYYASSPSSSGRSSYDGAYSSSKEKQPAIHYPKDKPKDKTPVVIDKGGVCQDKVRRQKDRDGGYHR